MGKTTILIASAFVWPYMHNPKGRSKKTGLPPGTLIHVGIARTEKARVSVIDYDTERLLEKELVDVTECIDLRDRPTVTWVNVDGIHDTALLQKIGDCFGLHPLLLEDIANTGQRPKLEEFEGHVYIVIKALVWDDAADRVIEEQISIVLGPNYVLSFQERAGDPFDPIRERIRTNKGRIRKMGSDYLCHSLIDITVDRYFDIVEKIGDHIERLENTLVNNPTPKVLHRINVLKNEMTSVRRSVWPLRDVLSQMQRSDNEFVKEETRLYFRDAYDHTVQIIETVETYRDILAGMLDIYLSSVSNRLNEVMKFLAIVTTVFMPLTLLTGIYGMNFRFMPGLNDPEGFWIILAIMVAVAVGMIAYFKQKKWW